MLGLRKWFYKIWKGGQVNNLDYLDQEIPMNDEWGKVVSLINEQHRLKALSSCRRYKINRLSLVEVQWVPIYSEDDDGCIVVFTDLSRLPLDTEYQTNDCRLHRFWLWDGQNVSPFNPIRNWTIGPGSIISFT